MNIRNTFEQVIAALTYGAALAILGCGTLLMCLPGVGMVA
jgi:hypothetical protein